MVQLTMGEREYREFIANFVKEIAAEDHGDYCYHDVWLADFLIIEFGDKYNGDNND